MSYRIARFGHFDPHSGFIFDPAPPLYLPRPPLHPGSNKSSPPIQLHLTPPRGTHFRTHSNLPRLLSILQLSSLAAVIPAPTRSLYASTKRAALLLFQSPAIEHSKIRCSFVLPSTVKGGFRGSAVDGSSPSSSSSTSSTATQEAKEGLS
ncbi:hypothetical protein V5O48_012012 [Marasmius crinis-equi]|uniref:Uncharacterized protein n=1 Tax=Marasmius crinis-equi TaxID=585013 RepID=A0ABR3F4K5_9AGAR